MKYRVHFSTTDNDDDDDGRTDGGVTLLDHVSVRVRSAFVIFGDALTKMSELHKEVCALLHSTCVARLVCLRMRTLKVEWLVDGLAFQ